VTRCERASLSGAVGEEDLAIGQSVQQVAGAPPIMGLLSVSGNAIGRPGGWQQES
jgi:hypothetical protein